MKRYAYCLLLEGMTEQRITFRYCLMDSAYDAKNISQFVFDKARIPIIDHNARRKDSREAFDVATGNAIRSATS